MDIRTPDLHLYHKKQIKDQGRKISWVARNLECSDALIHKYLKNGAMSQQRIIKLHNLLK